MKRSFRDRDAGFTMIELMITTGVMVIGLTLLIGAMVTLAAQSKVAEVRVTATNFTTSVIESMRGRGVDGILQFNEGDADLATSGGVIEIEGLEGLGTTKIEIWTTVSVTGGSEVQVAIPVSDEVLAELMAAGLANPIEVTARIMIDRGAGTGLEYKFQTSGMIFYL